MKKIKYLMVSAFAFLLSFPVLAADSCKEEGTKACNNVIKCLPRKLPDTVHTIILVLQIAVPVLLVIFGMIDLIKAVVAGKEDEIKKAQGIFVKRLIAGVLVFFVVAIVKLVFFLATDNDNQNIWSCADLFLNGVNGVK